MTTKKNIFVTGGAGFIGSALIRHIISETNHKVINLDKLSYSGNLQSLSSIKDSKSYFFEQIDICKQKELSNLFKEYMPDLIIHLAAFSGVKEFNKNVKKSFNNNVLSTKNIILHGFKKSNTKLIFASSAAVYGEVSKNKIEKSFSEFSGGYIIPPLIIS